MENTISNKNQRVADEYRKTKGHTKKFKEREERAKQLTALLKKMYPEPKSELYYKTKFQYVVAVAMSAQCTDKRVNIVNKELFKTYKTVDDFAEAKQHDLEQAISSVTFYRNKAKHIIAAAKIVRDEFGGRVPDNRADLMKLPGVASKTANVVMGELFDTWNGIAVDTHVRRFALRFDLTDKKTLDTIEPELMALVPKKDWKYLNNGFVLYGRHLCKARPHEDCKDHPLTKIWPPALDRWPKSK